MPPLDLLLNWAIPATVLGPFAAVLTLRVIARGSGAPPSDAARLTANVTLAAIGLVVGYLASQTILRSAGSFGASLAITSIAQWDWPVAARIIAGIILMDGIVWLGHVASHAIHPLWVLHRVHHSDMIVDSSTALRQHPLAVVAAYCINSFLAGLIGVPFISIMLFGLVAGFHDVAVHAAVRLPARLEAVLGLVFVTPGLHRLHHSADTAHFGSNYGSVLSIWDRMAQTFTAAREPVRTFGLPDADQPLRLGGLLALKSGASATPARFVGRAGHKASAASKQRRKKTNKISGRAAI